MKLVVDASVAAALVFPDERPESIAHIAQRMTQAETIAPKLFWYEIRATALKKERRGLLNATIVNEALRVIGDLPIRLRDPVDDGEILALARAHKLTFYDASWRPPITGCRRG